MRKKQTLPKSIKLEDFSKLMKAARKEDRQFKTACILGWGSGLRISEVTSLRKEDIDLTAKRIHVKLGKYSKDRIVPLPKGFGEKHLKFIPIKKSVRALQKNFKTAKNKAGLGELTFHSLRHGFATRLLENGMPINQVQLLLGHSSVATTNVYIRANPEDALKSYEDVF